jgi:hypothetical protein
MLRLRPSELTLTPEDVDEAFRRIANRQALRGSGHVSAQSGRPVLRRGPQRAVRDAITTLGDIPILRPRPQRATQSSVDDDIADESEQTTPSPRARIGRVSVSVSPTHVGRTLSANPDTSISPAPRTLHLPLRLRRAHEQTPDQPSLEHRFEEGSASPPLPESRSGELSHEAGLAGPSQHTSPTRPGTASSQAELRGGGPPGRDHARTFSQGMAPTPSSSRRVPPLSSVHDEKLAPKNSKSEITADKKVPTLRLKSFIKSKQEKKFVLEIDETGSSKRVFEVDEQGEQVVEVDKKGRAVFGFHDEDRPLRGTQTEPRRASGRLPGLVRSLSSGAASTYPGKPQRRERLNTSPDDVFGAHVGPSIGSHGGHHQPGGHNQQRLPSGTMPRHNSSEASAASEPFPLWELPPPSRQTSGNQSGGTAPLHPQYDGSPSSRDFNRSAYPDVRFSDIQAHNSQMHMNIGPSAADQHGFSPLPSMPYTRGSNTSSLSQAMPGGHTITPVPSGHVDAATAVMQGLLSPLDAYSEQYQHLIQQQNARQTMHAYPTTQHPSIQYSSGARYSSADIARRMNNRLPPQYPTSQYPTLQYSTPQYPAPQYPAPQYPTPHQGYGAAERPAQLTGRNAHATRTNQRSSENAPVRPPAQNRIPSRNSVVQSNRAAFEALHNLGNSESRSSRQSVPQPAVPREPGNQYRGPELSRTSTSRQQMRQPTPHQSSSPNPTFQQPPGTQLSPPAQRSSPAIPPTIPPPNGTNMRGGGVPDRSQTRARRRVTPARSPTYLQPPRLGPTISLAPDHISTTTRLRSPLLRTTTSARPLPRVRAQQRDQENSGAGEEQLMRQEAAAIQARYGEEDEERDVMDETPPRVGRVERRMFS